MDVWPWVAVGLTLIVLSRAIADNPLFRLSQYFFVGLALGYTATILLTRVFVPPISSAIQQGPTPQQATMLVPIALGVLMFTRLGKQQATWLANFPLAVLFGVGAAIALMGAIAGTILPQIRASFLTGAKAAADNPTPQNLSVLIGQLVLFVGLILVLLSFSFTRGRVNADGETLERGRLAVAGRWLLIFSLGVAFAGALITYQSALINQLQLIIRTLGLI